MRWKRVEEISIPFSGIYLGHGILAPASRKQIGAEPNAIAKSI
jgi:hypothetical protein